MKKPLKIAIWSLVIATITFRPLTAGGQSQGLLATKESRRVVVSTEAGGITAVDFSDAGIDVGSYRLEFFTLDTKSLFLPVLLHTDIVFYVDTGRGTISWIGKENTKGAIDVEPGDIYRLEEGTIFYIKSSSDTNREKLRIHAIFKMNEPNVGAAYSNVADLIRGFDVRILQMGFSVSEEVIEEIKKAEKPPPIIHFESGRERVKVDWREGVFEALLGRKTLQFLNDKKKETFNIMKRKPDVENKHGRSISVSHKDAKSLKGSSFGMFMVNLTGSSMVGPHWNPKAAEIAIVVRGQGMVQVISASSPMELEAYERMSFYVKEGDVFVVPRFNPMVQMSFENESFVFVGFSTNVKRNHPQFLAGKWSALRAMNREVLAAAFDVRDAALEQLLDAQEDAVLLGCEGCAEEVRKKLDAEIERKKWEEEEKRRREEEKERKEEEEARKREEERRQEEARRREEEEVRRREEEEAKKGEEEEAQRRKKEEEEAKKREEEKRRKEAEERRREEEEAKKREEEKRSEKEEAQRRKEEEQRREEKEGKKREEEKRREEEEERRREEEEEVQRRKKEEEEAKIREEEKRRKEEEAQGRKEEEERRREEEEEKQRRREVEEEAQKRAEEEKRRRGGERKMSLKKSIRGRGTQS